MNFHERIQKGQYTYVKGGPMPDGLIYEDIMADLMKVFKVAYQRSRGED